MASRQFTRGAEIWQAQYAGVGHGVGVGSALPEITRHQVVLTRLADGAEYREWISSADVNAVDEVELREAVERAIAARAGESTRSNEREE